MQFTLFFPQHAICLANRQALCHLFNSLYTNECLPPFLRQASADFYLRPLREPPPLDEPPPDERTPELLPDDAGARYVPDEEDELGVRTPALLPGERVLVVPDERVVVPDERVVLLEVLARTPELLCEEADERVVPVTFVAGWRTALLPDTRVPPVVADERVVLPEVLERMPVLLCEEAEARVVPDAEEADEERVVPPVLEAREADAALDEARVFVLPKVRAAADSRASLAERDIRVPVVEGAEDVREAGLLLVRTAAVLRVSRCNWRALVALLPRSDARAVNEWSGCPFAQSLRIMRSA